MYILPGGQWPVSKQLGTHVKSHMIRLKLKRLTGYGEHAKVELNKGL